MLAITKESKKSTRRVTPNILPCRINHSGPISITSTHWNPTTTTSTSTTSTSTKQPTPTAYFRGRKLLGRRLRVPEHYTGYLLQKTDNLIPQKATSKPHGYIASDELNGVDGMLADDELGETKVKAMECVAGFDDVIVWGHDQVPGEDDEYGRGMEEWMAFAEAVSTSLKSGQEHGRR